MSMKNRQLRTILPAIKIPANIEAAKISPKTRQEHSRHILQAKDLLKLLPRLLDPQTKKSSTRREHLSWSETSHLHEVETPKAVSKEIGYIYQGSSNAGYTGNPKAIYKSAGARQHNW